jgi:hypothetical protein
MEKSSTPSWPPQSVQLQLGRRSAPHWICVQHLPKLVMRGGYGSITQETSLAMDRTLGIRQLTNWTSSADGITVDQPLAQAFSTGVLPVTGNALHGLTSVGQGGGGVNPYHPDPRIKQFMFGFQYAFTPNDVLDVNYVGKPRNAHHPWRHELRPTGSEISFHGFGAEQPGGQSVCRRLEVPGTYRPAAKFLA